MLNTTARIAIALLLLGLSGTVVVVSASASDPIINYGQAFALWSDSFNSYCLSSFASGVYLKCDVGVTDSANATAFVISGGSGPVSTAAGSTASLRRRDGDIPYNNRYYCRATANTDGNVQCDMEYDTDSATQFSFVNTSPWADGYLHVNYSWVAFKNVFSGGWCSAQPSTQNNGVVQCNRSSVSTWESFHFVLL